MLVPSVVTWMYFVALAHHPAVLQYTAYTVGKAIQFGFPVVWVFLIQRRAASFKLPRLTGIWSALLFGSAVIAAMLLLHHFWLASSDIYPAATDEVRARIAGLGITTTGKYLLLALFYSLAHSFLEEYYFRWFVYGQLRKYLAVWPAALLSSLSFMAHHVIVLAIYFGWNSPVTVLFSLAVAVGGVMWALLYEWHKSLAGPWLSHLLVDAGIFIVGYQMVASQLQPLVP
jgi:membrane protease YdiL (CAAX protease family)